MRKYLWLITLVLLLPSCKQRDDYTIFKGGSKPTPQPKSNGTVTVNATNQTKGSPEELDFEIENATGRTIFVTCFSYIQKEPFVRWRWDKSSVYKLEPNQNVFINIDTIPDKSNRKHTYGYLAVFEDEEKAHDAIYELVDDTRKIDLDQLYNLEHKKVVVGIEKYGFKRAKLDFAIRDTFKKKRPAPELDFLVENNTGKTIFTTTFIYQAKDNVRMVWSYDKTPVLKLEPGQTSIVNVDTIDISRDRRYMSGFLAVFDEHEEEEAHEATYELLKPKNKLSLGRLSRLKNQRVIIEVEQYGSIGEITEFDLRPHATPLEPEETVVSHIVPSPPKEEPVKPIKKATPPRKNRGKYQLFAINDEITQA